MDETSRPTGGFKSEAQHECDRHTVGEFTSTNEPGRIGPIIDQLHSHALDRCGPAGEVRTSRHANGAGAPRLHALESRHALRSAGPDLAEPRSVRALQRSCLDAAVVGASPHWHACGE